MTVTTEILPGEALLHVKAVAALPDAPVRSVFRLSDAGKLPCRDQLELLMRWRLDELLDWVEVGCPVLHVKGGRYV